MKRVFALLLAANAGFCQVRNFNPVPNTVQRAIDSVQNAQLAAMGSMSRTLQTADSTKGAALNRLMTNGYGTYVGNLPTVLPIGVEQTVRNAQINLDEKWIGTAAGNRLLSIRGWPVLISAPASHQQLTIAHGLGYQPTFYKAQILSPAGAPAPSVIATSTFVILRFAGLQLPATDYIVMPEVR